MSEINWSLNADERLISGKTQGLKQTHCFPVVMLSFGYCDQIKPDLLSLKYLSIANFM
jgi:hypothetical protein